MTGSLQIKNDKYYMVLNSTKNGKRKQQWISTGLPVKGNKRRAEQMLREKLAEAEQQAAQPQQPQRCEMTVADCVRHWLTKAQRRVDEVTYQGYELQAKTHVLPYFDANRILVQDCTLSALQDFFDEKARSGRKDSKGGLSPASLRRLKNILNQSFTEAVKGGLISANPCQFVCRAAACRTLRGKLLHGGTAQGIVHGVGGRCLAASRANRRAVRSAPQRGTRPQVGQHRL